MKEQVREERSQRVHSDPIILSRASIDPVANTKALLEFVKTNQERIDVLAEAKAYADRQWLYWRDVAKWTNNQMEIVRLEAQLKLPL